MTSDAITGDPPPRPSGDAGSLPTTGTAGEFGGVGAPGAIGRMGETGKLGELDEWSLVLRARQGETGAFDRLVRLHERRVYSIARRLLGSGPEAEDAAQEAFLRLYRALGRLRPGRPVTPYLDHITVNVCRDLGRRRARRRELPLAPAGDDEADRPRPANDPVDPRTDPAADASLAELRRHTASALRTLPFKQRAALILRELHGLTTRQVAAAIGVSEATVRTHVCRGRLALRERLAALRHAAGTEPTPDLRREDTP